MSKIQGYVLIILIVIFLLLYLTTNFIFKEITMVVKWEYKIEAIDDLVFDYKMNSLGNDGWELVFARRAISDNKSLYECIFKRPKY